MASVCVRLDGIPLALELAAGRLGSLSVPEISSRLDQRFRLLTRGSRTALPRHQTLRALIDWSYDYLTPAEQLLLQRLSVFAGGWNLEAAEVVAGAGVGAGASEMHLPSSSTSTVADSNQATPYQAYCGKPQECSALDMLTGSRQP